MEKIKAFFENKVTKIVNWCTFCLSAVVLVLGGVTGAELSTGVELTTAIIGGVSALVAFIAQIVNKKKE